MRRLPRPIRYIHRGRKGQFQHFQRRSSLLHLCHLCTRCSHGPIQDLPFNPQGNQRASTKNNPFSQPTTSPNLPSRHSSADVNNNGTRLIRRRHRSTRVSLTNLSSINPKCRNRHRSKDNVQLRLSKIMPYSFRYMRYTLFAHSNIFPVIKTTLIPLRAQTWRYHGVEGPAKMFYEYTGKTVPY